MDDITAKSKPDLISVELSSRRTGMSFQRTRMSADRTLMSVIRTSLSLISFGFTIFQVFEKMREHNVIAHAGSGRNFGVTLVALGILMLVGGIAYHLQFMLGLRHERAGDDRSRPHPRQEPLSNIADVDHRDDPAVHRNRCDRQHALSDRTVRIGARRETQVDQLNRRRPWF